jgi:citrate synthase
MILAGLSAFGSADAMMGATRHQQKPMFQGNLENADEAIVRTVAYIASTIALVYCHRRGTTFTNPQPHRSLIGNLLLMMGFIDEQSGEDSRAETCLNKLWILYADHEMTNSTAAFLHAASSLTDPISCVIAGFVSGYGPLHGGAIELAYEAFAQIGSPENVAPFLDAVKAKKARLFGYGHRVLKTRDPRAVLLKEVFPPEQAKDKLLQIAFEVDRAARKDPYFVERGLHANVDLYGSFPYLDL